MKTQFVKDLEVLLQNKALEAFSGSKDPETCEEIRNEFKDLLDEFMANYDREEMQLSTMHSGCKVVNLNGVPVLFGRIKDDVAKRFQDGETIRTSRIVKISCNVDSLVVHTQNSNYLLLGNELEVNMSENAPF